MKKCWKFMIVFLIVALLAPHTSIYAVSISEKNTNVSLISEDAKKLYYETNYIESSTIEDGGVTIQDGLTVIYGSGLNVSAIKSCVEQSFQSSLQADICQDVNISTESVEENRNTYMMLYMKNGDMIDVEYVSVIYEDDVNPDNVDRFVSSQLSKANIEKSVLEFLDDQIKTSNSALNRLENKTEATQIKSMGSNTYSTTAAILPYVAVRIRDTSHYIANYTYLWYEYPVMIYKNNITYEAIFIPDGLEDDNSYFIIAYAYITPGNAISSSAAEGIYNDTFGEKIIVCGAKTQFFNEWPELGDYFITMSPMNNGLSTRDINGRDVSFKLATDLEEISLEFNISAPDEDSIINMTTHFDAEDITYVEFLAEQEVLFSKTYVAIAEDTFYYTAGVYMNSSTHILDTKVGTGIYFCFENKIETLRFAGLSNDIYYEAE